MLLKPKFGERCNGCGMCCIAEPCSLAVEALGEHEGPCKLLEQADGRYYCGLLRNAPAQLQPVIAFTLAIGSGCDSSDGWIESRVGREYTNRD
jgi:hypothetical protein